MTLTIDLGFNISLERGDHRRSWTLPIARRRFRFGRSGPGKLATLATCLGIVTNSVLWGVLS